MNEKERSGAKMKIGRYQVTRELACGGMARVFLATAPCGRQVVVKRPLRETRDSFDRLEDEARAGTRLAHPHIVETLDMFADAQGVPHLVLGYIQGPTLLDLRKAGPLESDIVLRIGRQMAEALACMHAVADDEGKALKMVHRDISPSNIVLGTDGHAYLIDLGIVRSVEASSAKTNTGVLRGKVGYLAPELFDGQPSSPASDLWALGIVLFEAALGRRALSGTQPEITARILGGKALSLRPGEVLDERLHKALSQLVANDPKRRLRSAREAAALFCMLEHDSADDADVRAMAIARSTAQPKALDGGERGPRTPEKSLTPYAETHDPEELEKTGPSPGWRGQRYRSLRPEIVHAATDGFHDALSGTSPVGSGEVPTAQQRLLHYVAELQSLTHPKESGATIPLVASDPWARDSSPGY